VDFEVHPTAVPEMGDLGTAPGIAYSLDFHAPMTRPPGATELRRSEYSPGLDIWVHSRLDPSERQPGIVFVHGGGWGAGSPSFHLRHAHQLAARGWVTAIITYRLTASGATWPAPLEDVQAALGWLRASAGGLGLDPDRMAVGGGSAGGHLSAMAALDPANRLGAAVLWYPAVDLRSFAAVPDYAVMTDALMPGADPAALLAASPVGNVHAGAPPMLTFTGDVDPITTLDDIAGFHDQLTEHGVANELLVFKGRDHGFDFHPEDWQACFDRMCAFLHAVLVTPTPT
jgi:acetyl esterase/lipase